MFKRAKADHIAAEEKHLKDVANASFQEDEDIAELAYELWISRGCPDGVAEEDWLEAVSQLAMDNRRDSSG